jgi:hypothetical protein
MVRSYRNLVPVAAFAALMGFSGGEIAAQTNRPPTGLMLGSTIEDRLRGRDRDRDRDRDRRYNHNPGWTGGVGFTPGYGQGYYGYDQPVVIVNNSPCYIPGYYAGYNGYRSYGYSTGGFSAGLQMGGVSLGYRQNNGYYNSNSYYGGAPAPGTSYVRETVREYVAPVEPIYSRGDDPVYDVRVRPDTSEERREPSVVPSRGSSGENDYYLHRKPSALTKNPALADAIRNIETAFRTGNLASLERHIDRGGKLVLQVKGTTRQEMAADDYLAMTRDALKVMKTARYELTKIDPASNGAMMVSGTHVLRTEDGQQKSFTVGFILKPRGENWVITEVSAEPAK